MIQIQQKGKANFRGLRSLTALISFGLLSLLLVQSLTSLSTAYAQAPGPCGADETVVRGDTLFAIAQRCETTVDAILAANPGIEDRNLIYPGQLLIIPIPGEEDAAEAEVRIVPDAGPPGTVISVTAANFPPSAEVMVAIGPPESEAVSSLTTTTDISGTANARISTPEDAQPEQRFVVAVFEPEPEGKREFSEEFVTTGGGLFPTLQITPTSGVAGTEVELLANGLTPNASYEIGFGRIDSEYDVISSGTINDGGVVRRQVRVPGTATPLDQFVFVVVDGETERKAISNVFTATQNGEPLNPQVQISPQSGPGGTNVQVAIRDFPANRRISFGLAAGDQNILSLQSTRTDGEGAAYATLEVPEDLPPAENYSVLAYVPGQRQEFNAVSLPFSVTDNRDENGQHLFTRTNIYLVALEDAGRSGVVVGCGDSLVPVEVEIEPTVAPLTAALEKLLSSEGRFYGQSGLYNSLYRSELNVDRIDITNGVASIYLTGALRIGGVCDEPRVRAQLEEIALQFSTVAEALIFINGEPLTF